jgi:hypothetical protein
MPGWGAIWEILLKKSTFCGGNNRDEGSMIFANVFFLIRTVGRSNLEPENKFDRYT